MSPFSPPGLPDAVVAALRCSVCEAPVELVERALRCSQGHAFDLAKQGYVNLLHARIPAGTADTAEMVAARVDFLAAGHYAPLAAAVAAHAKSAGLIVDAGAGTGYYLASALENAPEAYGLALDVSALALRRAARAHPRVGAAVWNLWEPWPVASDSAAVILNVFAPRNTAEFHRVLQADGALIVASPGARHLGELKAVVELLDIGEDKEQRLDNALGSLFALEQREEVSYPLTLEPEEVRQVVGMGPNAHHLHRDGRAAQLAALDSAVRVTASFTVSVYRPL